MTQTQVPNIPRRPPAIAKLAFGVQSFLLRRNWMGSAGNFLMVITTTGRKSGKQFSTPIGYVRDGSDVLAFNVGGGSNWYKNVLVNPTVTLNIKGQAAQYRGEPVRDPAALTAVLDAYKQHAPNMFDRFFGISKDRPSDELAVSPELKAVFIRFRPLK
jgi:deazaflavin-dependent oxidoreductase (nitroreductase family)